MSLPTDSVAPAPPTGTSNPWSLVQWWKRICDWIAALSPSGASVYDTGWENVPLRAGFTHNLQLQVRRIGLVVYAQGRVTGSFTTSNVIIGDIPVGFRPTTAERPALTFNTNAALGGSAAIATSGEIAISAQTAGSATVNFYTSWLSA